LKTLDIKKFFLKATLFLLPLVLVFGYIEYKLSKIPSQYEKKMDKFIAIKDSCEVLVLGNSHEQNAIYTKYIDSKNINMAFGSQTLYQDAYIMDYALDNMPKLKTIVLGMDYHSLFNKMQGEKWREFFYLKYYNIPLRDNSSSVFNIHKFSYIALHGGFSSLSLLYPKTTPLPLTKVKPTPSDTSYEAFFQPEIVTDRVKFHTDRYSEKAIKENLTYLCPKLYKARNKAIKVVFIDTPCHESYNALLDSHIVSRNIAIIDSLCMVFGIKYYSYAWDKRFIKSDFANPDHLNEKGGIKFSTMLNKEVLKDK
jgi:hypothetical protein